MSEIDDVFERKHSGLTEALLTPRGLKGCDFTPCFFRKGKVKPFERLEADESEDYVTALRSLTYVEVDILGVIRFVSSPYGQKTSNINEAIFKAFMRISDCNKKEHLAKFKINCASLPPCKEVLDNQIRQAQFVASYWKRADQTDPSGTESPTDYGWRENQGMLESDWYTGCSLPTFIADTPTNKDNDS